MKISVTIMGKTSTTTSEEILANNPVAPLRSFLEEESDVTSITLYRSGSAFLGETYTKEEGPMADLAHRLRDIMSGSKY